ncbi:MAG TPA: TadE/TadG family type IV pilus assembly protein [Acidimicrobiales bacterium]|nr:TadE/TadG family type IV pilus assembly protein [Acidimicrobiales bacterium]
MIEMALALPLLLLFLYGIISYGVLMAAQHTLVQSAADAARAAVASTEPSTAALDQADTSLGWLGQCGLSGVTCTATPTAGACSAAVSAPCITVVIKYDYADHPLVPELPGLNLVMPSTIQASTTTLLAPQS